MNNILIPKKLEDRTEQRKRIDFQRIQEYIKKGSKGNLDLRKTPLTKLPDNLTRVEGTLCINASSIEDLNNLEYIKQNLYADYSKLKSLPPKLTRIRWVLSLSGCPIGDLNNLEYVGGSLWIDRTNISELPEGLVVDGNLFINSSSLREIYPDIKSLRKYLEERNIKVGGNLYLYNCKAI